MSRRDSQPELQPSWQAGVRVPAWVPTVTLGAAVVGLALAGYLTVERYTAATTLACPETGLVNCRKVTQSAQSTFVGIPVVLLGLGYFAATFALCLPAAWRSGSPWLRHTRVGVVALGAVFVCYLVYTELFTLDAICLWCTAVHVVTLLQFAAVMLAAATLPLPTRATGGGTAAAAPARRGVDR